jgi:hypothetical protein
MPCSKVFASTEARGLVGHAKRSVMSKSIHTLDIALIMAAK